MRLTPIRQLHNQRKEVVHIPPKVLREAIVNAVMHRDYSIGIRKIPAEFCSMTKLNFMFGLEHLEIPVVNLSDDQIADELLDD